MKKILATMLVGVFALASIAQTVVYDYRATFRRIDPIYKLRTLSIDGTRGQYVTESYNVKSDSITGYVVLPLCKKCEGGTLETSEDYDETTDGFVPFAYLARRGDNMTRRYWDGDTITAPYVVKTIVGASSAVFSPSVFTRTVSHSSDPAVKLPRTMSAWMTLDYLLPTTSRPDALLNPGHVIAKAASTEEENMLTYGFLGLDNTFGTLDTWANGFGEGYVVNKGFGKATVVTTPGVAGTIGVCEEEDATEGTSCNIISSISGSMVGMVSYEGPCYTTPMWDLCDVSDDGVINVAPIAGTWTLKYNKALSKGDTEAQEAAIQTRMGWATATKVELEDADELD